MNDIERIYSLLLHSNGLKIRAISQELELDKYYVAEIMFSSQNIPYWYQDDDSLWYAKEGALQIKEPKEEKDELVIPVEIPQKFNINRFLKEDISDSLRAYLNQISKYRTYSNDELIELFRRYRNGDKKAYDLIIKSQQRFVANIALLYAGKGASLEDIIQEGNVGLVKAVERFDYTQSRSFSNYAKSWILQMISASMTSMPYMIRLPQNQLTLYRKVRKFKEKFEQLHGYNPSVNDIEIGEDIDAERIKYLDGLPYNLSSLTSLSSDLDINESDTNAIDDFVNTNESKMTVKNLLRYLSDREKHIIKRFYGINTKEEELSTIGVYLGLTRERVRQIKEKTVRHLRDILRSRGIKVGYKNSMTQEADDLDDNQNIQSEQEQQKERNDPDEIQHNIQEIDGLKVGDEIYFDRKYCTIKKIVKKGKSSKLSIEYANGVLDVVSYRKSRCEKKRPKFQLSTSLSDLVELNIITEKQLYHCNKKGLETIGDVEQIIKRYHLTPDSTRFTKYTLDMWFSIVGLLKK